jgi:hypothetical protein
LSDASGTAAEDAVKPRSLPRRLLRGTGCMVLGTFVMLVVLEGLSSVAYLAIRLVRDRSLAEERHTRYDPDLGWAGEPNPSLPDLYGKGVYLHTNAQGFRGTQPVSPAVPAGRRRAICSGDSYTLGYGVDDDHTWCHLLAGLSPGLRTVNMGQGGYGVDQAYLWYRRDAAALDSQIHLFAFITHDFLRMQSDVFIGYGKPLLRLRDGRLAVTNVPVPKVPPVVRWLDAHAGHLNNLAMVRLGSAIKKKLSPPRSFAEDDDTSGQPVAARLFAELAALDHAKGTRLVLIYLPTPADFRGHESDDWRRFTAETARSLDVPFLDLVDALRRVPAGEADGFFIKAPQVQYFGAAGHYTAPGNAWVAGQIHAWLAGLGEP